MYEKFIFLALVFTLLAGFSGAAPAGTAPASVAPAGATPVDVASADAASGGKPHGADPTALAPAGAAPAGAASASATSASAASADAAPAEIKEEDPRYKYLRLFSDVLYAIERSYVQPIKAKQLIQGAVKGMLQQLDPYSYFLNSKQLKKLKQESRGSRRGIGIEAEFKQDSLLIISVFKNSPAWKAGIQPGDKILEINNKKTIGLNIQDITKKLRHFGKKDILLLKIQSSKEKQAREVQLKPAKIYVPSVEYRKEKDGVIYIQVHTFTEQTHKEVRAILQKNKKLQGVVLDLRGNPGGLLDSAVKTADLFIKTGLIVSVKGRRKEYKQVFRAHSKGTWLDFPMIVLIDSYSASAAEVLAGALKDSGRALLLGRTSFGKGSVQTLVPVKGGAKEQDKGIKLTVAYYYSPKGSSIHGLGVKPHIELKAPEVKSLNTTETFKSDSDIQSSLGYLKALHHFKK